MDKDHKLFDRIKKGKEISRHSGHALFRILLQSRINYLVFLNNYRDFKAAFEGYSNNFEKLRSNRLLKNRTLRTIIKCTYNTTSSSRTYVEFIDKSKGTSAASPFSAEKQRLIANLNEIGLYQFMRALRNFSIHEGPISTTFIDAYHTDDDGQKTHRQFISMEKDIFEASLMQEIEKKKKKKEPYKYDQIAYDFLKNISGKLDLYDLMNQYYELIEQTHQSFRKAFIQHYYDTLADFASRLGILRNNNELYNSEVPINPAQERYLNLLLKLKI